MILIVMGVCGCGKTTIGEAIAAKLGCEFSDGDQHHSAENVAKMSSGTPLTDEDRLPWLLTIHDVIRRWVTCNKDAVITCSALKRKYRNILLHGREDTSGTTTNDQAAFVYLKGTPEVITERMGRREHFMAPTMVPSQFRDLEEPGPDEPHVTVSIEKDPSDIVQQVADFISKSRNS